MEEIGLKREELTFGNDEKQLEISASDRDSARKREIAVSDRTVRNLAYFITIGFFSVLGVMMFGVVDATSKDVLLVMLGTLGSAFTGVIAYYFGTTAGSKAKTELLAKAEPLK